jgi:hypothetical protein
LRHERNQSAVMTERRRHDGTTPAVCDPLCRDESRFIKDHRVCHDVDAAGCNELRKDARTEN